MSENPPADSEPPLNLGDDQLRTLKRHVAAMSELALGMVADGSRALLTNDATLAKSVTDRDTALDRLDVANETEAMHLIATLQPEAEVLRTIGASLKIANCIDRVGRLGFDLAKNLTTAPETSDPRPAELLRAMDEKSRAMVQQSITAFLEEDGPKAKEVFALDDDVDDLYNELTDRLFHLLLQGGPASERLAHYLLAARHLERVGDNACKIAERAVYAITGERRPEYFPAIAHRATQGVRPPAHSS